MQCVSLPEKKAKKQKTKKQKNSLSLFYAVQTGCHVDVFQINSQLTIIVLCCADWMLCGCLPDKQPTHYHCSVLCRLIAGGGFRLRRQLHGDSSERRTVPTSRPPARLSRRHLRYRHGFCLARLSQTLPRYLLQVMPFGWLTLTPSCVFKHVQQFRGRICLLVA